MIWRARRLLGLLAGAVALALIGVFVVGMRTKSPAVQGAVRRVNRAVTNPRTMRTAGTVGASASVVHHVGRRSGAAYATPVVPVESEDGFIIALPYGTRADWVQNVLAAGRATITHGGRTFEVRDPDVVPTEKVERYFDEPERRAHRAFNVVECLRLWHVHTPGVPPADGDEASSLL
jgi:deazaflavin-dependent oxidoreductase (nitroreductase family)